MVLNSAAFTKFAELQEKELLQKEAEMAQKLLQAQKEAKQAQKKAEQAQKLADMAVVGPIAVFTCLSRIRAPPKRCLTSLGPLKFGLWTQMRLGSEPRIRTAPSSCAGLAQQSKDSCRSLCHPLLPGRVGDGLNAWTLRDLGPRAAAG
jgi:multidrug efflux pump subunit AcrA (membrane-fusion protein)